MALIAFGRLRQEASPELVAALQGLARIELGYKILLAPGSWRRGVVSFLRTDPRRRQRLRLGLPASKRSV